jgi:F-type H+-transporting ATPase subunit b
MRAMTRVGLVALAIATLAPSTLLAWNEPPKPDPAAENGADGDDDATSEKSGEEGESGNAESGNAEAGKEEKDHAGGEFHDPMDLSHANASPGLYEPGQWRTDLAIITMVVFLLLFGVLLKFAWGPISEGLEKREQGIVNKINEADRDAEAAANRLGEYESKLSGAEAEAQALLAKANQAADASAAQIRQDAEADATQQKQRATADIEAARNVAVDELGAQSVSIAVQLASQIVGRELSKDDHATLIKDALKQFSSTS